MENLPYHTTPLKSIAAELDRFFSEMESEGQVSRATSSNLVIPLTAGDDLSSLENFISNLMQYHPGRYFLLIEDDSSPEIQAQVSARCQIIRKGEHGCSEEVRLRFPRRLWPAVPSVVLGNLLTGISTELFLRSSLLNLEQMRNLGSIADTIIFDSSVYPELYSAKQEFVLALMSVRAELVDLQWIGLGVWRDQIKHIFSRTLAAPILENLSALEFECPAGTDGLPCVNALLLAGWIMRRLKLNLIDGAQGSYVCETSSGREVKLKFKLTGGKKTESGLASVKFCTEKAKGKRAFSAKVVRGTSLENIVELNETFRFSAALDKEDMESRLQKYFLIGESIANYRGALYTMHKILSLQ